MSYFEYKFCVSDRSTTTHFFFIKLSISEHSGSFGTCINKREKKYSLNFLSAKGAEGGGSLSLADMSAKKSSFFYALPKLYLTSGLIELSGLGIEVEDPTIPYPPTRES